MIFNLIDTRRICFTIHSHINKTMDKELIIINNQCLFNKALFYSVRIIIYNGGSVKKHEKN